MFGWKLGLITWSSVIGNWAFISDSGTVYLARKKPFQCLDLPLFQECCSTSSKYVVCKLMNTKPGCFLREKRYICANGIKSYFTSA